MNDATEGLEDPTLYELLVASQMASRPTTHDPRAYLPDSDVAVESPRARSSRAPFAASQISGRVVCRNRGGRRPETVAVVLRVTGFVWTTLSGSLGSQQRLYGSGEDFDVMCRCGLSHVVDGGLLRSALDDAKTTRGKVPIVDVSRVERVAPR